ncbi:MAG: HEAT repeat domain-containing protein [Candidatus Latescibacteria bacterium]|nr:HEAT repeat domain-containing protein [Candidatus Latescibacterota bacterium]
MRVGRLLLLMFILAAFVLLLTRWERQFRLQKHPVFRPRHAGDNLTTYVWGTPFSREPVDSLIKRLDTDETEVKVKTAHALAHLCDPRAATPLLSLLGDGHPEVVAAGLFALAKLREKQALEPSIRLLEHPNPRVRAMAAFALGELGDKRAIGPLNEALGDSDEATKYLAKRSLKKLLVLYKVRIAP